MFEKRLVAGTQQTVIAHLVEASGQNMLEEATDELRGLKGHGFPPAFSGIFVAECDLPALYSKDTAVCDGGLVDIPGKIGQGFIGGMVTGLAVNHPGGVPYRFGKYCLQEFPARQGDKGSPEEIRQGAYRHEISLSGLKPISVVMGDSACRYETVDVGVVDQCPRPGMKDTEHADLPAHIAGICRQFHQRQGCGLHQKGIEDLLVRPDDPMQFPGDRKDGMVVGNRQLFPPSFFKPRLSLGFVAGGTASVFAGMIGIAQMIAVAAPEEMASHPLGAAVDDILHRPSVTWRHGVTVPVAVLGTAGPENIRYPRHGVKNRPRGDSRFRQGCENSYLSDGCNGPLFGDFDAPGVPGSPAG